MEKVRLVPIDEYVFTVCKGFWSTAAEAIGVHRTYISRWVHGMGPRSVRAPIRRRLLACSVDPDSISRIWDREHARRVAAVAACEPLRKRPRGRPFARRRVSNMATANELAREPVEKQTSMELWP